MTVDFLAHANAYVSGADMIVIGNFLKSALSLMVTTLSEMCLGMAGACVGSTTWPVDVSTWQCRQDLELTRAHEVYDSLVGSLGPVFVNIVHGIYDKGQRMEQDVAQFNIRKISIVRNRAASTSPQCAAAALRYITGMSQGHRS